MINYKFPGKVYTEIPYYENGEYSTMSFDSKEDFATFLEENCFKEIGEYQFNQEVHDVALRMQKNYNDLGYYSDLREGTKDHDEFWDNEKLFCRKGLIMKIDGRYYYFSRFLYFWLNFCPIYWKDLKMVLLPSLMDVHYHVDLYEFIARLKGLHGIMTKKRQMGSTFYHISVPVCLIWFEPSVVTQMGASLEQYNTGPKGAWRFAETYRDHLNQHTPWRRPISGGQGDWTQVHKHTNEYGIEVLKGRKGVFTATSFERSPTNGVGGAKDYFFHEEAGVAPKMDATYEFIKSALEDGDLATGFFIGAGSVGDLTQCEPLKNYMYAPEENGFCGVMNKLASKDGPPIKTGLFISEVHGYKGFVDEFGNSDVAGAMKHLEQQKEKWQRDLHPKAYATRCSQKPTYLDEAFKFRGESDMPIALLEGHEQRLKRNEFPYESVDLEYSSTGNINEIEIFESSRIPITEFPINPKMPDKRGAIQIWERPIKQLKPLLTYYMSVDPVRKGKTITSDSLIAVYVYRNPQLVTRYINGQMENTQEGDRIVCAWTGRYDDINDSIDEIIKIMLLYQAWTLMESNVDVVINEIKRRRLQKYLVQSKQFVFNREIGYATIDNNTEYGWVNRGRIFEDILLNNLLKFVTETLYTETDEEGNPVRTIKGVVRIPDAMAIKEMILYYKGLNVDRMISLSALATLIYVHSGNRGGFVETIVKTDESEDGDFTMMQNPKNISTLNRSPFKTLGKSKSGMSRSGKRSGFRNIK